MVKLLKTTGTNLALLSLIATATQAGGFHYVSSTDGTPLVDAGLIEVNTGMLDEAGNAAARTTEAGSKMAASNVPATQLAAVSSFGLITGAVLPAGRKRGGGGGAPAKYPFESMEIGNSFFVPVSAETPEPVKTMSATVSNWNEKYKVETGETEVVKRAKRGEDGKVIKGEDGKNVMEEVTRNIKKSERKFASRAVESGKKYGEWVAPSDGVLVSRIALD